MDRRILNCQSNATTLDDCDPVSYVIKVGMAVGTGVVISIFVFFGIWPLLFGRYCCNCCGGREQSPGLCCPPNKDKHLPARYGKWDLWRAKLLMFALTALAVTAIIWGTERSAQVVSGVNGLSAALAATPKHIFSKVEQMNAELIVDIYDPKTDQTSKLDIFGNSSTMAQARSVRDTLDKDVNGAMGSYSSTIDSFAFVLFIIFTVPSAVVILGTPLAICNIRRWLPMLLVWLTFVLTMGVWIVHGAFAGTSIVVDGLCTEVSGAANNRRNIITPLTGCKTSIFKAYLTSFSELRDGRAEIACTAVEPLCYVPADSVVTNLNNGRIYDCGPTSKLGCPGITLANFSDAVDALRIHSAIENTGPALQAGATCQTDPYKTNCLLRSCAFDCTSPSNGSLSVVGRVSKGIVSLVDAAVQVSITMDTLGNQFANCDAIMSFLMEPFDQPCVTLTAGVAGARDAAGMQGIAGIGAIFALVFGSKRFISGDEAGKAQGADDEASKNAK